MQKDRTSRVEQGFEFRKRWNFWQTEWGKRPFALLTSWGLEVLGGWGWGGFVMSWGVCSTTSTQFQPESCSLMGACNSCRSKIHLYLVHNVFWNFVECSQKMLDSIRLNYKVNLNKHLKSLFKNSNVRTASLEQ